MVLKTNLQYIHYWSLISLRATVPFFFQWGNSYFFRLRNPPTGLAPPWMWCRSSRGRVGAGYRWQVWVLDQACPEDISLAGLGVEVRLHSLQTILSDSSVSLLLQLEVGGIYVAQQSLLAFLNPAKVALISDNFLVSCQTWHCPLGPGLPRHQLWPSRVFMKQDQGTWLVPRLTDGNSGRQMLL